MPKMLELKDKARILRVKNYSRMRKENLIWAIQEAEGNDPCFHRIPDCGQEDCLFRPDCLPQE